MLRALLILLSLLAASPALADDEPLPRPAPAPALAPTPERLDPIAFVGLRAGIFVFVGEIALDAGLALDRWNIAWLHGEAVLGFDSQGDRTTYDWKGGLAGLELRTPTRRARLVAGVDAGMVRVSEASEGEPVDTTSDYLVTVHGGGELVGFEDHAVFRLGLGTSTRGPHLRLGIAIQF